jgi:hypothetical protein
VIVFQVACHTVVLCIYVLPHDIGSAPFPSHSRNKRVLHLLLMARSGIIGCWPTCYLYPDWNLSVNAGHCWVHCDSLADSRGYAHKLVCNEAILTKRSSLLSKLCSRQRPITLTSIDCCYCDRAVAALDLLLFVHSTPTNTSCDLALLSHRGCASRLLGSVLETRFLLVCKVRLRRLPRCQE